MRKEPHIIEIRKGKKYYICTCGRSGNIPFCDGSHAGTEFRPSAISAEQDGKVAICGCFQSNNLPYCDGTHKILK